MTFKETKLKLYNMTNLNEIRNERLKKIKNLKAKRKNPYPIFTKRDFSIEKLIRNFSRLEKQKKEIVTAGRIMSLRKHGKLIFFDIFDGNSKIQVCLRENGVGEKAFLFFRDNFDIGDFIEVRGYCFKTKTKEKTIDVVDFKMLSKSLLPLPEKWHGLLDVEERFRKRYLDLIFNKELKSKFEIRSKIIREIRNFLEKNGFIEVETPILQTIYGGAKAQPFKTHLNALNIDLYLRISPELYLKRLIIAGFEKVYEIGKCFRNEGIDREHNPEFTMLEFYWAYQDYKGLMKFTEKLLSNLVYKLFKKYKIEYQGDQINFKPPYPRIEFLSLFEKETKIKYNLLNVDGLRKKAKQLGVEIDSKDTKTEIADKIYKKYCRPKIKNPTFIIHHPIGFFPLAKSLNDQKLANFQLVVGGIELINAFSELNDPIEQKKRFELQEKLYKSGLKEAQRMDKDFITALEYGMPPAAGFGMGIDRLSAILTNSKTLREIILFPIMRPKK